MPQKDSKEGLEGHTTPQGSSNILRANVHIKIGHVISDNQTSVPRLVGLNVILATGEELHKVLGC